MIRTDAITLYTADTPNGLKIGIFLQEADIPYAQVALDLERGDQHQPDYLAINSNGKIPAIVDGDAGLAIFESGAILDYLADKYGRFSASTPVGRTQVRQWLYFQVSGIGPMLGQLWWFLHGASGTNAEAIARYRKESHRLFGVVERRLRASRFLAMDDYTIADMAAFPWLRTHEELDLDIADYPAVRRWLENIAARPAVQRAIAANRLPGVSRHDTAATVARA